MADRRATDTRTDPIAAIGALVEPARRRLYEWVVGQRRAVGRDEAAAALGISRALAAFHLDRLVAAGLLATEFRRLTGRSGPGAGRPAKLYRPVAADIAVSLPDRRYELAARLFAEGLETVIGGQAGSGIGTAVDAAAARRGAELGAEVRRRAGRRPSRRSLRSAMIEVLAEHGYAPCETDDGIRFANCPYDALVAEHRPLICGANTALAAGLVGEIGELGLTASLDPRPGWCCVAIGDADVAPHGAPATAEGG